MGIGLGFAGIVKQAFDGQEIEAKKKKDLEALKKPRESESVINMNKREEDKNGIAEVSDLTQPFSQPKTPPAVRQSQGQPPVSVANSRYSFLPAIIGNQIQSFVAGITGAQDSRSNAP